MDSGNGFLYRLLDSYRWFTDKIRIYGFFWVVSAFAADRTLLRLNAGLTYFIALAIVHCKDVK